MGMEIIDNFLSENDYILIKNTMFSNNFPWFLNPVLDSMRGENDSLELTHSFYYNYSWNSNSSNIIYPILNKINPSAILRIRAALMPKKISQIENAWHTDNDSDCITAIYYVNSNNGYTKFENGSIVESIANRFVFFNSQALHTGTFCTDEDFRCLINFNFFK